MTKKNPLAEEQKPSIHDTMAAIPEKDADEAIDSIRISENVIASVTRRYVLQIDGVVRFHSGSLVSGLAEMIGRKSQDRSIVVTLDGEEVHIGVNLVLRFGVKVPEVASAVQNIIRSKVEELTGKHVSGVRVTIQDLQDVEEEKPADKEADS